MRLGSDVVLHLRGTSQKEFYLRIKFIQQWVLPVFGSKSADEDIVLLIVPLKCGYHGLCFCGQVNPSAITPSTLSWQSTAVIEC